MATNTSHFTQKGSPVSEGPGTAAPGRQRPLQHGGRFRPSDLLEAADVIAVLLTRHLLYDWLNPKEPANDHLIYSKGHASPLCYAMFKAGASSRMRSFLPSVRLVSAFRVIPRRSFRGLT